MSIGIHSYGLSAQRDAVPHDLLSSSAPKPMPSTVQRVSINSASGDQTLITSSGLIRFEIPTASAGYLRERSWFLRCRVAVTGGIVDTWGFKGPTKSAHAIIRRLTVYVGGVAVETIDQYHKYADLMLCHAASDNFVHADSQILQRSRYSDNPTVNGTSAYVDVCIPLLSGLLNSEQAIPAFLLTAPISIQIDLNPLANAVFSPLGALTSYNVVQPRLCYQTIKVDHDFMQSAKAALMQGNLFQIPMTTTQGFTVAVPAAAPSINYQISANLSSSKAVLWTSTVATDSVDSKQNEVFKANGLSAAGSDCKLYVDGQLLNNYPVDALCAQYAELNSALSNLFDTNCCSVKLDPDADSLTEYTSSIYAGGFSLNRSLDAGFAMSGTPAQLLQLQLTFGGAAAAATAYIFSVFDQIMVIDATGQVNLIK
jgi:hypothetical protein